MNGRLPTLVMVFVALAIVISLVVALAPDASAQDSMTAPDSSADWTHYNVPASQDLQTTCCGNANFIGQRRRCITIMYDGTGALIGPESAGFPQPYPQVEGGRWFCGGSAR